ncbi:unnamed protein product [Arabidopsis halleri]
MRGWWFESTQICLLSIPFNFIMSLDNTNFEFKLVNMMICRCNCYILAGLFLFEQPARRKVELIIVEATATIHSYSVDVLFGLLATKQGL